MNQPRLLARDLIVYDFVRKIEKRRKFQTKKMILSCLD